MRNPNILFIQVDQMSASTLGAYGDPVCHAPVLDSIAENGVVFENAYCNFPLCAPSRFSMASGQLCSAIGAYDNAAEFFAEIPTYAHYLRTLGYQTSLSGKMHFIGPDQYHGFEKRHTADLYPADFSWVPNWGNEGKRDTNDARSVTISGLCERSKQIDFDDEVADKAMKAIQTIADEHSEGKDQRPFFMQISFTHPHEPYLCQQEYWDLYKEVVIPEPTVGSMPEEQHDVHSRRLLADFGMLNVPFKKEDVERARRAYYGSISFIDSKIGKIVDLLKRTGLDKSTALVFTSDHGDMLGERGMWFKKHFYEKSLRIPLMIQAPWIKPNRINELVSLVDLLPTFNGLATGEQWHDDGGTLEGLDLTSILDQDASTMNRAVYAEYLAEATTAPIFMIRRGYLKYVFSEHDPELLFDLEKDPDELNNVATDDRYHREIEQFRSEVQGKWDSAALSQKILESQKGRLLIRESVKQGNEVRWNHDEEPGQEVPWYRGVGSYNEWAFDYSPVKAPST